MLKYVVIIPTYRRESFIRKNWLPQAKLFRLVLVCPPDEVALYQEMSSDWIVCSDGGVRGPGAARAAGLDFIVNRLAMLPHVIFVGDDDCKVHAPDLERVAQRIKKDEIIIGAAWPFDYMHDDLVEKDSLGVFWGFPGWLPSKIGGFDPRFVMCEDREFQLRARWYGVRTYSDPKWKVPHKRHNPGGMSEEMYSWEVAYEMFEKKYPGLMKPSFGSDGKMRSLRRDKNYAP